MKENWFALFLCTQISISIDKALICMGFSKNNEKKKGLHYNMRPSKYSEEYMQNIFRLRDEGKTYKQIGQLLGLSKCQVEGAVRMNKKKATRTPTRVVQAAI